MASRNKEQYKVSPGRGVTPAFRRLSLPAMPGKQKKAFNENR